jgi:hypothetical protein
MPSYSIQDIKIDSGVSEENGSFKAFLDFPINIYYNVTETNLHAADLVGADTWGQIAWNFSTPTDDTPLTLNGTEYAGNEITNNQIFVRGVSPNSTTKGGFVSLSLIDLIGQDLTGEIVITAIPYVENDANQSFEAKPEWKSTVTINFEYPLDTTDPDNSEFLDNVETTGSNAPPAIVGKPFFARIVGLRNGNTIEIDRNWDEFRIGYHDETGESVQPQLYPTEAFESWNIIHKYQDPRDLLTYIHLGDDKVALVTNLREDKQTFENYPYSTLVKLYEPLPDDVEEKDNVYVVKELLPQKTEVVDLLPYDQEDEDVLVLRVPDSNLVDSPITKRATDFKSYSDLVTNDRQLQKDIIDKYISGSQKPIELNIDYTNYENFINFSSATKRLKNFKYKMQQIESYTAQSSSKAEITNGAADALIFESKVRDIKNNFDSYENYLYNVSSSYISSSLGVFPDAAWPKTGSGTYADPFKPVSSSHTSFTNWYGSEVSRAGQLYTASLYDRNNPNRLVNLLPTHVREEVENKQFFDFMDMIGQHFDELWVYTKAIADITDRQNDLSKGFSKDLIFNLSKALGFDVQDGKDLLELSRVGFGQKSSGSAYTLYTSGSLSSPAEGDVSKEITKRIVASMPYLLKSKGTIGSLKGLMNCYGIPSSILRVREYGGIQKDNHRAQFEIARKFTKALGFNLKQYVETTWADDDNSSRKPETVELRFRSPSTGSDQILIQKDADWAIKLKDNNSPDKYGTVSFMLSGSEGYKEISSSLLPVFDGEYHSVMLRKSKINTELFPFTSFETGSLVNPPFLPGTNSAERGEIEIVSSSNVAKVGSKSLRHKNTSNDGTSYTHFYRKSFPDTHSSYSSTMVDVSQYETYLFSAYAKASGSTVDSLAKLTLFELDSNEQVVNWDVEFDYSTNEGGVKSSQQVGLNETEWRQVQVKKTIKFPNTTKLGIRFENDKPNSTLFWDDVSLRKVSANTDIIADAFRYDLFVKKYDAGLDRIIHSSKTNLTISSSVSESYNAAWTGSGDLFIGGNNTTPFSATRLSGSLMEFRLWTEPVEEEFFDIHVSNPKSYVGNSVSSSYTNLVRRFSFDDNTTLSDGDSLRDVSANQTYTQSGSARGFGGSNLFESVIDKTKTIIPNHGPNRRMATKIRIENNVLSGSGAVLNRNTRFDQSSNDFAPIDSAKLGIYFSPTDVINEDIVSSFANLDFNQYLGDPRDDFEQHYSELKDVSDVYFQKYDGNNNFWDYMHIIKYYDQSIFKQLKKLVPARAKSHMGTLIEGNIFERPKSPVQRNHPSFTKPFYEDTINFSQLETEHEASRSLVSIESQYPSYTASLDNYDLFRTPALYNLSSSNDNYKDRNLYLNSDAKAGGPNKVFSEPTGSIVIENRKSIHNKEYRFFYTSSIDFDKSSLSSTNRYENLYTSKSLVESDLDAEYQYVLPLNRSFYEGVKNTKYTTLDGDLPIIIRTTSPTVAVPTDFGISKLRIDDDTEKGVS